MRCQELIPWLEQYGFKLKNKTDKATCHPPNVNEDTVSIINLTFVIKAIKADIDNWYINEEAATGSDHELIHYFIQTDLTDLFINLIKVDKYNL